jgi:hypothetical protein
MRASAAVLIAALLAALLAAMAACHAPSQRAAPPDRTPPANTQEPADESYDWHALLIAPFGSVLKDIPLALHEVLLFRDDARGTAAANGAAVADGAVDAECYAADAPAPRFVGHTPEEYLLCFKQDRLSRIQASVRLTTAAASEVFAAACERWLKNAAPAGSIAAAPAAGIQGAPPPSGAAACAGRDGAIHFSGRLEEEPTRTDTAQTDTVLSITLDGAPEP